MRLRCAGGNAVATGSGIRQKTFKELRKKVVAYQKDMFIYIENKITDMPTNANFEQKEKSSISRIMPSVAVIQNRSSNTTLLVIYIIPKNFPIFLSFFESNF